MRTTTTLITLCALTAALTLAPTQATAMDDNGGGTGECKPNAGMPSGFGWDGYEVCTLDSSNGGFGGGASGADSSWGIGSGGATPGAEIIGEPIYVEGSRPQAPRCLARPWECVPDPLRGRGGRPLGIDGDGPSGGGPKGGGTPAKGEVRNTVTKEWCRKLKNRQLPTDTRLLQVEAQIKDLWARYKAFNHRLTNELQKKAARLSGELESLRAQANPGPRQIQILEAKFTGATREVTDMRYEMESTLTDRMGLVDKRADLEEEVARVRKVLLERCAERYSRSEFSE